MMHVSAPPNSSTEVCASAMALLGLLDEATLLSLKRAVEANGMDGIPRAAFCRLLCAEVQRLATTTESESSGDDAQRWPVDEASLSRIVRSVDRFDTGRISFGAFMSFMLSAGRKGGEASQPSTADGSSAASSTADMAVIPVANTQVAPEAAGFFHTAAPLSEAATPGCFALATRRSVAFWDAAQLAKDVPLSRVEAAVDVGQQIKCFATLSPASTPSAGILARGLASRDGVTRDVEVACGFANGRIVLYDAATGSRTRECRVSGTPLCMAWSPAVSRWSRVTGAAALPVQGMLLVGLSNGTVAGLGLNGSGLIRVSWTQRLVDSSVAAGGSGARVVSAGTVGGASGWVGPYSKGSAPSTSNQPTSIAGPSASHSGAAETAALLIDRLAVIPSLGVALCHAADHLCLICTLSGKLLVKPIALHDCARMASRAAARQHPVQTGSQQQRSLPSGDRWRLGSMVAHEGLATFCFTVAQLPGVVFSFDRATLATPSTDTVPIPLVSNEAHHSTVHVASDPWCDAGVVTLDTSGVIRRWDLKNQRNLEHNQSTVCNRVGGIASPQVLGEVQSFTCCQGVGLLAVGKGGISLVVHRDDARYVKAVQDHEAQVSRRKVVPTRAERRASRGARLSDDTASSSESADSDSDSSSNHSTSSAFVYEDGESDDAGGSDVDRLLQAFASGLSPRRGSAARSLRRASLSQQQPATDGQPLSSRIKGASSPSNHLLEKHVAAFAVPELASLLVDSTEGEASRSSAALLVVSTGYLRLVDGQRNDRTGIPVEYRCTPFDGSSVVAQRRRFCALAKIDWNPGGPGGRRAASASSAERSSGGASRESDRATTTSSTTTVSMDAGITAACLGPGQLCVVVATTERTLALVSLEEATAGEVSLLRIVNHSQPFATNSPAASPAPITSLWYDPDHHVLGWRAADGSVSTGVLEAESATLRRYTMGPITSMGHVAAMAAERFEGPPSLGSPHTIVAVADTSDMRVKLFVVGKLGELVTLHAAASLEEEATIPASPSGATTSNAFFFTEPQLAASPQPRLPPHSRHLSRDEVDEDEGAADALCPSSRLRVAAVGFGQPRDEMPSAAFSVWVCLRATTVEPWMARNFGVTSEAGATATYSLHRGSNVVLRRDSARGMPTCIAGGFDEIPVVGFRDGVWAQLNQESSTSSPPRLHCGHPSPAALAPAVSSTGSRLLLHLQGTHAPLRFHPKHGIAARPASSRQRASFLLRDDREQVGDVLSRPLQQADGSRSNSLATPAGSSQSSKLPRTSTSRTAGAGLSIHVTSASEPRGVVAAGSDDEDANNEAILASTYSGGGTAASAGRGLLGIRRRIGIAQAAQSMNSPHSPLTSSSSRTQRLVPPSIRHGGSGGGAAPPVVPQPLRHRSLSAGVNRQIEAARRLVLAEEKSGLPNGGRRRASMR